LYILLIFDSEFRYLDEKNVINLYYFRQVLQEDDRQKEKFPNPFNGPVSED
jgi:hypothetical protein